MEHRRLPDEREAIVHKFTVGPQSGYLRVGFFEDGSVGEIFINMDKSSENGPWACISLLISMALQRGIPLSDIVKKLAFMQFEPRGFTKDECIRSANSVADYIVRWLDANYGERIYGSKAPKA